MSGTPGDSSPTETDQQPQQIGDILEPKFENLKNNSNPGQKKKWGGAREGAGRPKGGMNYSTLERMKIKKALEDRIHQNADRLLNAALTKALGESYLFCRRTIGSGAKQRTETELITDTETIIAYLNDELDNTDEEYYYISTKPVDMGAIRELYDRAFGRPQQKVEETGEKKLIIETRKHSSNA
jgi:hypothetical protein